MTTITSLLLLLLYSSFTVGFAAADATAREENTFTPKTYVKRYWDKKITNNLPKPWFLLSKASPLSAAQTATFSKLAANHALPTRLHEFCSSAHLLCSIDSSKTSRNHNQNGDFAAYQDHKNFTNYGTNQGGNSFKKYSLNQHTTPSQNEFRRYSKGSIGYIDNFQNYASGSTKAKQGFHTYGATDSEFEQYADSVNDPHLRFASYADQGGGRTQSFTGYSERSNSGDQVFSNYGQNGTADEEDFISYATESNVVESNFTNYGELGGGVADKFNGYGLNANVADSNFKNYGNGGMGNRETFTDYRNGSNVGADGFTSYVKNTLGGHADFENYGKNGNVGEDTFVKYGEGANDPEVRFKGYMSLKDSNKFKEYAKSGVSFEEYNNESSTNGASSVASKGSGGRFVNKWVEPGKFFRESMLKEGTVMPMPDIRDKMPERSFLPRSILSKLPFSSSRISELKEVFRVADGSSMEKVITSSLSECEKTPSQGETKRCVGSIENMIDFATTVLGRDITVRTTENVNGSKKNVMVGSIKRVNGGRVTQSVSCHQSLFPYLLYYCHSVPKVRVYEADLLDPDTKVKINHGVAICHLDTSAWSPTHGAFLALGPGPGNIEVCHWIFQNDMTWAIAD